MLSDLFLGFSKLQNPALSGSVCYISGFLDDTNDFIGRRRSFYFSPELPMEGLTRIEYNESSKDIIDVRRYLIFITN